MAVLDASTISSVAKAYPYQNLFAAGIQVPPAGTEKGSRREGTQCEDSSRATDHLASKKVIAGHSSVSSNTSKHKSAHEPKKQSKRSNVQPQSPVSAKKRREANQPTLAKFFSVKKPRTE